MKIMTVMTAAGLGFFVGATSTNAAPITAAPTTASVSAAPAISAPDLPTWAGMTPRAEKYATVTKRSVYFPAADGVRLAADIYLPEGRAEDARLPTVLYQTRYYRSGSLNDDPINSCKAIRPQYAFFAKRGYAVVVIDVRGTGASFGTHLNEYSEAEVRDGTAIADWIVAQPWSNGRIGATGASYVGTTAELFVLNRHPAIKAIAPLSSGWDFYAEVLFPGGIPNRFLNDSWGHANAALDAGKTVLAPAASIRALAGPCRVDEDKDGALLAAAQAEHAGNFNISNALQVARFRDDPLGNADRWPAVYPFAQAIDASQVPSLYLVGWADAGYGLAALNRIRNSHAATQHVIIGASNHGMQSFAAPGVTASTPSLFDPAAAILRFFDHYVAGLANGADQDPRIRWFVTGANEWRSAQAWPKPARFETFCLAAERQLRAESCGDKSSLDVTPADAATGETTRWNTTLGGGAVIYPDRRAIDDRLASFTSEPLAVPLDVAGSPVITLEVSNTVADADYCVYLEEILPSGQSNYVTEGMLRASHGKRGALPYQTLLAPHSDLRREAQLDTARKTLLLDIGMLPVAHRFAAGSRLRVALAGSDEAHFSSPALAGQHWTLFVGARASSLRLPVTAQSGIMGSGVASTATVPSAAALGAGATGSPAPRASASAMRALNSSDAPLRRRVAAVLKKTPLIDGHNDLLWELRDRFHGEAASVDLQLDTAHFPAPANSAPLMTDIPRLRAGLVGGEFWSVWVPAESHGSEAVQLTLEQIDLLKRIVSRYPATFELARTAADVRRIHAAGKVASLIGIEGGHQINDSLAVLRQMADLGVRYVTLTHVLSTGWADSATDAPRHHGLSSFGETVIRELNRLGLLVDLSHVSTDTMRAALALTKAPVIFSHSSARALVDHPRNVPDDILHAVAANGGIVMVNFNPAYVSTERLQWDAERFAELARETSPPYGGLYIGQPERAKQALAQWEVAHPQPIATVQQVADHIDHIRTVAGVDHVGIGSDFDGITSTPRGLEGVDTIPNLLVELMRRGWSDAEVSKVAGQNILRVMEAAERVGATLARVR